MCLQVGFCGYDCGCGAACEEDVAERQLCAAADAGRLDAHTTTYYPDAAFFGCLPTAQKQSFKLRNEGNDCRTGDFSNLPTRSYGSKPTPPEIVRLLLALAFLFGGCLAFIPLSFLCLSISLSREENT